MGSASTVLKDIHNKCALEQCQAVARIAGYFGWPIITRSRRGSSRVVTVHRVRREKLSIPGLDGGELRFDFARAVSYRR